MLREQFHRERTTLELATEHRGGLKSGAHAGAVLSGDLTLTRWVQIAWVSIGLASWRFRKAWVRQGRSLSELKYRAAWTWPWGPPFVVLTTLSLIISTYTSSARRVLFASDRALLRSSGMVLRHPPLLGRRLRIILH